MKKLSFILTLLMVLIAGPVRSQTTLSETQAARFLDQATWGPTPASIASLQKMGIDKWLAAQFALKTSDIPDQPYLDANGKVNRDLRPVDSAFFENAVMGQDQLRQRVAFVLSQIWVVSSLDVGYAAAFPPYWRVFRDNAFGNYRNIIKAVSLSPAMGHYLNMANNNKGNPAKNTSANENYGRELMQLFTLGLTQLNPDGSAMVDSKGNPVATYDQSIVTNVSKALTGWTYPTAPGATPKNNNPAYYTGEMFAVQANHDTSAKKIFGDYTIPAGRTAEQDLEAVVNPLMNQTTMAPFVSQQLIEHLVTSNPSPAYIKRVSEVFLENSGGVRGDMKAVIAAILTDPEARAGDDLTAAAISNFGHLREPVLFMANILRGLNAALPDPNTVATYAAELGQNLFTAPSVFSYFSPQYRTEKGLLGPEFQIYSTQTVADRADIVNSILYGTLGKTFKIDLTPFMKYSTDTAALTDYVSYVFLHHDMSTDLRQAVTDAVNAATTPQNRVLAALYIALTSGEYQIIH